MLKFLDKPITWKSYILMALTVAVVSAAIGVVREGYYEYQYGLKYEDDEYDED